jgi:mannosyltransferase
MIRARRLASQDALRHVALFVLILLALVVFSYRLSARPIWNDEGVSLAIASMPWRSAATAITYEPNMVLYYVLLRAWLLLGHSESTIRFLSVLAAVAAVGLTFAAAERWLGRREAVLASLLLPLNAYFVRYAQEARSYALLTCVVVGIMLSARQAISSRPGRSLFFLAVLGAVAFYLQVLSVLVFMAALLVLVVSGIRSRIFEPLILYALLTLPLWLLLLRGQEHLTWIPAPSASYLLSSSKLLAGNGGLPLVCIYGCLIFISLVITARERSWTLALLVAWALLPATMMITAGLLGYPLFVPRYAVMSLPAWAMLAAVVLCRLPRPAGAPVAGAIIVIAALACIRSYGQSVEIDVMDDMRATAAFIASRAQPGDSVVVYWPQSVFAYNYYAAAWPSTAPVVFPELSEPEGVFGRSPRWNMTGLAATQRLWFVEQGYGEADFTAESLHQMRIRYCSGAELHTFGSIGVRLCVPQ